MARSAAPDSAGAQFFFSAGPDTVLLNDQGTYVTFGRTSTGLDVLEEILASHVDQPDNPLGGAPDPAVTVRSVTIVES
jgi:cyclophilin family peptidyl-prolyl cis-trans isomerase